VVRGVRVEVSSVEGGADRLEIAVMKHAGTCPAGTWLVSPSIVLTLHTRKVSPVVALFRPYSKKANPGARLTDPSASARF